MIFGSNLLVIHKIIKLLIVIYVFKIVYYTNSIVVESFINFAEVNIKEGIGNGILSNE